MLEHSGFLAATDRLPISALLFAREPEPDLDLDDLTNETNQGRGLGPSKQPPRRRPLVLMLLLALVAVLAYVSTQPDLLMDLLGQGTPPPPQIPPSAPGAAKPAAPPLTVPSQSAGAIPGTPPAGPAVPASPPSPGVQGTAPVPPVPTPLFSEGQRVTVVPDPAQPASPVSLSADAGGVRPGPVVSVGATLTVLDGELQNNAWIYAVRTPEGARGWIAEKRLQAKP